MTRLNIITCLALLSAALVLAAAVFVVTRPKAPADADADAEILRDPPDEAKSGALAARAASVGDAPRPLEARRRVFLNLIIKAAQVLPSIIVAPTTAQQQAGAGNGTIDGTASLREAQLRAVAVRRIQLIVQADEKAFDAVKASELTRIAIRRINDDFAKQIRLFSILEPSAGITTEGGPPPSDAWTAAEVERRAAIDGLFDPRAARDFENAERAAQGSHYRRRWSAAFTARAAFPIMPPGDGQ